MSSTRVQRAFKSSPLGASLLARAAHVVREAKRIARLPHVVREPRTPVTLAALALPAVDDIDLETEALLGGLEYGVLPQYNDLEIEAFLADPTSHTVPAVPAIVEEMSFSDFLATLDRTINELEECCNASKSLALFG